MGGDKLMLAAIFSRRIYLHVNALFTCLSGDDIVKLLFRRMDPRHVVSLSNSLI